ncbi:Rxt3p SCDLUD_004278 [Saccharomycodes ludwigii]|uniref:Rxt3p n=1 Tax=Saccharomycodes ludwigii TaxID=36035 RepID=UPI001E81F30F|nr:hypothetical protein SCDLUD_004278 [Saccharomycodes ludwigii]KAH3899962.1 hypothetical protein SCDLUD_004278 [Saccharomycodes ludwigii]
MTNSKLGDDDYYKQTQSQIYGMQETLLNASRDLKRQQKKKKIEYFPYDEGVVLDTGANILALANDKYPQNTDKSNGLMRYHPYKRGQFVKDYANDNTIGSDLLYDNLILEKPDVFLPIFNTYDICKTIDIFISYEDLINMDKYPRVVNNEIWGSDIYTDDSDVLLIIKHQSIFENDSGDNGNIWRKLKYIQTIHGIEDCDINGHKEFDIVCSLILLPTLQVYHGELTRNKVSSRTWGRDNSECSITDILHNENNAHDGLSIAINKIKILDRSGEVRERETE